MAEMINHMKVNKIIVDPKESKPIQVQASRRLRVLAEKADPNMTMQDLKAAGFKG